MAAQKPGSSSPDALARALGAGQPASAARPPRRVFIDVPVYTFTGWDSVPLVRQALSDLEFGNFRAASLLIDAMGRDDRVTGVMRNRIGSVLSSPVEFDPAEEDDELSETMREALEEDWSKMYDEAVFAEILDWGLKIGVCAVEIIWDMPTGGKRWTPKLKAWHPQFLMWRWDTRSFWIITQDEQVEIKQGDPKWFLFTPFGVQRGWIRGLVRVLGTLWIMRQWALRDWGRYNEVHGMPVRKAIVPWEADEPLKERFGQELAALGSESVIKTPQREDGTGFDLELVEAKADTWETFEGSLDKVETCMAIAVLGQNLTTEAGTGGSSGSLAQGKVHEGTRQDICDSDAEVISTQYRAQVLQWWAVYNFGEDARDKCPWSRWDTEPEENLGELAKAFSDLAVALPNLTTAGSDLDKLLKRFGIDVTEHGPIMPTLPGEDPPDDETRNPFEKPPAPPPALGPDGKPVPPGAGAPPKPTQPPARADVRAWVLKQLQKGRGRNLPKTRPSKKSGVVVGQMFVDAVGDKAVRAGSKMLAPDVEVLMGLVNRAHNLAGLQKAVEHEYANMDPAALAEVLRRAMLLAELAGRLAVLEDA